MKLMENKTLKITTNVIDGNKTLKITTNEIDGKPKSRFRIDQEMLKYVLLLFYSDISFSRHVVSYL